MSNCDPIRDQAFTLERMQLALEGSHIGTWDWNLVTGEMHVDRRTRALWGISDETSASFEHFRNALHPQDRERSNDAIGAALDPTREGDYEFECRVISQADRLERWIEVGGRTFFENGRAIRILGTVRDISERKHRERHVRILLRELVHRSRSLLAVVQAMSQQTAAGAASLEEVQGKFEARLQALQARIRPHFLFNSLNAVLSLIRKDPKRAEGALEDLAELFRTVMADNRQLIALRDELSLCRQYLNLEQLRLGERLRVDWRLDPAVDEALVPPMVLQPLVENAVYHGIEPGIAPGVIEVRIERRNDRLWLQLTNPYHEDYQHRQGNRMALANIRERLQLHFDVEASLNTRIADGRYEIGITMPYRTSL